MRCLWLLLLAALVFACDKVDYIEIEPADVEFQARGEARNLSARCMSRAGYRAERAIVSWRVKDPDIAEIDQKAQLKPKRSGLTEVIAKYGDVEAAIPVRVRFVEKVEVLTPSLTLREGSEAQPIKLKFLGLDGKDLGKRAATYAVRDKTVAAIVGGDSVLPLDPGTTVVDIQVDGLKASVEVTVEADKAKKK